MKEELLEAIYGTVERLEQKVDELSDSTKNAGAETVPASNDITKLDKSINAMFIKEEEVRGKISKLRDAIVVFADLIKVELGKNEQRSKFLVDAVKQMRQGNDVFSKALQDKLEVMNKSPQKKVVTHRFEPTSKNVLLFIGGLVLYNPQNEMFSHLGTKRYNFKNETQLFKVIPHTSKFQKNRPASPERNTFEGS